MSAALLRLSAPQDDTAAWRAYVLSVCAQYPEAAINDRLRWLTSNGYLTYYGTPRAGWLTDKGRAALTQHAS